MSSTEMTCGLKVDTRCKGWDKAMSEILSKIQGVSYVLDAEEGMICISGKVDPHKILRKIARCGKHAELCWMKTGSSGVPYNSYVNNTQAMDERPYVPFGGMPMLPFSPLPYHGGHYPHPPPYGRPFPPHLLPPPPQFLPPYPYNY